LVGEEATLAEDFDTIEASLIGEKSGAAIGFDDDSGIRNGVNLGGMALREDSRQRDWRHLVLGLADGL
jgi:hypothetical protein